jgi:hypothetical protein
MITLTLRHYRSRFGWEIAAFWLVSLGNSALLVGNGRSSLLSATAVLEIVALAWITVRLVLAEDGFRTSGGWKARPFSPVVRHLLPLGLAAVVVFLPAVVRAVAFHRLFPDTAWIDLGVGGWLRQYGVWLLFIALPLKLFGLLILQGVEGRAKSAAWAVLALILLPMLATTGTDFAKKRQQRNFSRSGDGDPRTLAQGIQLELPGSKDFLGAWNDPISLPEVPAARVLLRIPLNATSMPAGVAVRSSGAGLRGARVNVDFRALFVDSKLPFQLEQAIPVLRYADGAVGSCLQQRSNNLGPPLPFLRTTEWRFSGDFASPLAMPEFEGDPLALTRGLELMFFVPGESQPSQVTDPRRYRSESSTEARYEFAPATMGELFRQFPWSDQVWQKTALPFLKDHATRADVPFLLERLRSDTRLADFFIAKGWTADAMPILRELAKERLPMSPAAIIALAGEKDPALAADLAALALDTKFGFEEIEPALRAQPGFDWPAFAKELWRRRKYTINWLQPYGNFWLPALWAAQEGDFTAFRKTAEQAARGHKWEQERLANLVEGGHEDLIGYLRENIDRMTYDSTTRKWGHKE